MIALSTDYREVPDEPPAAPPSPQRRFSRRTLLAGGAATLGAAATGAVCWQRQPVRNALADLGLGPLADAQNRFQKERAPYAAEYLRTGELPSEETRRQLFLRREWIRFLREHFDDQTPRSFSDAERAMVEQFHGAIVTRFRTNRPGGADAEHLSETVYGTPSVSRICHLKDAFHAEAGDTYNRDASTVFDPAIDRRLQCLGGTRSILTIAQRLRAEGELTLRDGETLVEIYTEGHVLPGILLPDQRLIGFEATTTGDGIRNFGPLKTLQTPAQVVRADHALYQAALGVKAFTDKVVLFDNVPPELREKRPGISLTGGRTSGNFDAQGYGFGSAAVKGGDQAMSRVDFLPADSSATEEGPARPLRESSDRKLLAKISNPQERAVVELALNHIHYCHREFWLRHAEIINPLLRQPTLYSKEQAKKKIDECADLIQTFDAYLQQTRAQQHYERAITILNRNGLNFEVISPGDERDAILNNANVAARKWAEASVQ